MKTIIIAFLFAASTASAQWVQTSALVSRTSWCMRASGQTIFAGTEDGITRSTDNGLTWSTVNTGLANTDVWSLETDGSSVFAGTAAGVFRSTDNGATWEITDTTFKNTGTESLHLNGNHLFAGTGGSGVFRSSNNGATWDSADVGLTDNYVFTVTSSGANIYAGTGGQGVFRSTNNGTNWTPLASGVYPIVRALTCFAGSIYAGGANGTYRSTNDGSSWTSSSSGLTNNFILNFSVYQSNIFACGHGGVYVSTDSGSTWIEMNLGLPQKGVHSIAIAGTTIFAGVDSSGIWRRALGDVVSAIRDVGDPLPDRFAVDQNFPNPFNPTTTITFSVPQNVHVTITVFDILGHQIQTLISQEYSAGTFNVGWNASLLPSGVYVYRIQAGAFQATRKMVLQK